MDHLAGHVKDLSARVVIEGYLVEGRDLHRRGDHPGLLMLPVSVEFIAQCAREPVIGKHPGVKSLDAVDACGDRQRTQQHRPEPAALIGVRHS